MHRDPTLRKRNALVIPGVLLVLVSLTGILYVQLLRGDGGSCDDGKLVVLAGACRSATLLLVIPLAIGVLLTGLGARLRNPEHCRLGHGTAATTGLAILIAAFVLSALAALAVAAMEDPEDPYVVTYSDVEYRQARVLAGVAGIGFLLLLPYLLLYLGTGRPPRCCREKACFDPCYCDEDAAAPVPTFPESAPSPALPLPPPPTDNAQVTTTPWTGPTSHVHPLPPPDKVGLMRVPAPATPKLDEPKAVEHDAWPATSHEAPAEAPEPAPAAEAAQDAPAEPGGDEAKDGKPKPKAKKTSTRKVTRKSAKSGK